MIENNERKESKKQLLAKVLSKKYQVDTKESLTGVTPLLTEFPDELIIELLNSYYSNSEPNQRILATVLNSVITDKKGVFTFSRPILDNLLERDENIKRNSINSKEFNTFFKKTMPQHFKMIHPFNIADKKPAIWKLSDIDLINFLQEVIGKIDFENQEKKCCRFLNISSTSFGSSSESSRDIEIEEELDKELVKERDDDYEVNSIKYFIKKLKTKHSVGYYPNINKEIPLVVNDLLDLGFTELEVARELETFVKLFISSKTESQSAERFEQIKSGKTKEIKSILAKLLLKKGEHFDHSYTIHCLMAPRMEETIEVIKRKIKRAQEELKSAQSDEQRDEISEDIEHYRLKIYMLNKVFNGNEAKKYYEIAELLA